MPKSPRVLTDDERAQVEALAAYLTAEQIADRLGIARRTFYNIMDRDEDVSARYKKGKSQAIALVAQSLIQKAIKGDGPSAMFFLKTQAGWRETIAFNHGGQPGNPIETVNKIELYGVRPNGDPSDKDT